MSVQLAPSERRSPLDFSVAIPTYEDAEWLIQPAILAGDPLGSPPDSPSDRIDPNTTTSPFAGVGSVGVSVPGVGDFLGSGTAISRRHILTAAHVLDVQNDDGIADVLPENAVFNLNFGGILTHQIAASAVTIFPGYQGFEATPNNDLAILTLSEDLPDGLPIYNLNRGNLLPDSELIMVGYGTTGDGITGFLPRSASFDVKRVGYNQVEDLSAFSDFEGIFLYDFDGADPATNLFGAIGSGGSLGNDRESSVGPGDSGGPSFINQGGSLLLAGVNTFTFGVPPNLGLPGFVQGTFGTGGGGVVVSDADKLEWIDSIIGTPSLTGSIAGSKWHDLDADGIWDTSEAGLAGWTIYLDVNENDRLDGGELNTVTDAAGNYALTGLAAGTYRVAEVMQPGWQQSFPLAGTVTRFSADFSDAAGNPSADGFTFDNTGGAVPGLWKLSTGRGSDRGHSADDSVYFGQGESASGGGNYNVGHTAGRIISPLIDLQNLDSAELSFNYFLNVEIPFDTDQASVKVARNGGSFEAIATKNNGILATINPVWRNAVLDLSDYVGDQIQIQFDFDTIDALFNRTEGWYVDDVVVRGTADGTHRVTLASGESVTGVNFGNREVVLDPPAPELPSLSIGDGAIAEGDTGTRSLTLTVSLSAPASEEVTVQYTTADGTAIANQDYQPLSGTLTFAPGETSQSITVQLLGDSTAEADEQFSVLLSAPTGATLGDGAAIATILNDDAPTVIRGSGGNDQLRGTSNPDFIRGRGGNDRIQGGGGDDVLVGNLGDDRLVGGAGNDQLRGGAGDDTLIGGAGDDILLGNGGDDVLLGGGGNDTMTGGRGSDRFVFRSVNDAVDQITDFNRFADFIDLRSLLRNSLYTSLTPLADYVRWQQVGADTVVQVDANGNAPDGFADLVILAGITASQLSSRSFIS